MPRRSIRGIPRSREFPLLAATCAALLTLSTYWSSPAHAAACGTMNVGSGTSADPWQVWTTADLESITQGNSVCVGPGGESYFAQMADITKTTSTPVVQPNLVRYDGNGHTVTISSVTGFSGLFSGTNNDTITRLVVHSAGGSTLATGKGWVADTDNGSTFSFISTDGAISQSGGGIVGSDAVGTTVTDSYSSGDIQSRGGGLIGEEAGRLLSTITVTRSHSSGSIGSNAGGLVGMIQYGPDRNIIVTDSYSTGAITGAGAGGILGGYWLLNGGTGTISRTFSTGAITGAGAGGIAGIYFAANGGVANISNTFTTGVISGNQAGGFIGKNSVLYAGAVTISNSYSTGNILGGTAGGFIGDRTSTGGTISITNSYTSGSSGLTTNGYFANGGSATNSYSEAANSSSGWNSDHAASVLTGAPNPTFGTSWGSCIVNQPFFISGFYAHDPCVATPSVSIDGLGATPSSLTFGALGSVAVASTFDADPLSYVSLVNDTGSVSVGGSTCVAATDCTLPDLLQAYDSGATMGVSGFGAVRIKRYDSTTLQTVELGTLTISQTPSPSGGGSASASNSPITPTPTPTPSSSPSVSPSSTSVSMQPEPLTTIVGKLSRSGRDNSLVIVRGQTSRLPLGTELKSRYRIHGTGKTQLGKPARVRWDGRFTWMLKSNRPITVYFLDSHGHKSARIRG